MSEENSSTLETKLKEKLDSGEITEEEYNELMKKFGSLDLLESKIGNNETETKTKKQQNWRISGSASRIGEDVGGPVKVSGKLNVDGSLKCETLTLSGSTFISGDLVVVEDTKISGKLVVQQDSKFGDFLKISGKFTNHGKIFSTNDIKLSGKINCDDDLITSGLLKVSGSINSKNIKSQSNIIINGKINVLEDVIADEFVSSGGHSFIGRNLIAKTVEIAKKYRLRESNTNYDEDQEDDIPDLGRFVTKIVSQFVPIFFEGGYRYPPQQFEIKGDIQADDIDISYVDVDGDLIGNNIIIGPSVNIKGIIKYTETLEVPEGSNYNSEKISKN